MASFHSISPSCLSILKPPVILDITPGCTQNSLVVHDASSPRASGLALRSTFSQVVGSSRNAQPGLMGIFNNRDERQMILPEGDIRRFMSVFGNHLTDFAKKQIKEKCKSRDAEDTLMLQILHHNLAAHVLRPSERHLFLVAIERALRHFSLAISVSGGSFKIHTRREYLSQFAKLQLSDETAMTVYENQGTTEELYIHMADLVRKAIAQKKIREISGRIFYPKGQLIAGEAIQQYWKGLFPLLLPQELAWLLKATRSPEGVAKIIATVYRPETEDSLVEIRVLSILARLPLGAGSGVSLTSILDALLSNPDTRDVGLNLLLQSQILLRWESSLAFYRAYVQLQKNHPNWYDDLYDVCLQFRLCPEEKRRFGIINANTVPERFLLAMDKLMDDCDVVKQIQGIDELKALAKSKYLPSALKDRIAIILLEFDLVADRPVQSVARVALTEIKEVIDGPLAESVAWTLGANSKEIKQILKAKNRGDKEALKKLIESGKPQAVDALRAYTELDKNLLGLDFSRLQQFPRMIGITVSPMQFKLLHQAEAKYDPVRVSGATTHNWHLIPKIGLKGFVEVEGELDQNMIFEALDHGMRPLPMPDDILLRYLAQPKLTRKKIKATLKLMEPMLSVEKRQELLREVNRVRKDHLFRQIQHAARTRGLFDFEQANTVVALEKIMARLMADPRLAQGLVFRGGMVLMNTIAPNRFTSDIDADAIISPALQQDSFDAMMKKTLMDSPVEDDLWICDIRSVILKKDDSETLMRFDVDYFFVAPVYEKAMVPDTYGWVSYEADSYSSGGTRWGPITYKEADSVAIDSRRISRINIDIRLTHNELVVASALEMTPLLASMSRIACRAYPLEFIIAEKLHALFYNPFPRGKDIYDLAHFIPLCHSARRLNSVVSKIFSTRGTPLPDSFAGAVAALPREKFYPSWSEAKQWGEKLGYDQNWELLLGALEKTEKT